MFVATNRDDVPGRKDELVTFLSGDPLVVVSPASFRRGLIESLLGDGVPRIIGVVHGYNVDWEESLELFALVERHIRPRIESPVAVVGFSWPSAGDLTGYPDDRHAAQASAVALSSVIFGAVRAVESMSCPAELSLICHSMGNFAAAHAFRSTWETLGRPASYNVFSDVLLVAADLDAEDLEPGRVGEAFSVFARRVTVYRSRADRALLASSVKRAGLSGGRLGRHGPEHPDRIPSNVVTVDATSQTKNADVRPHSAYFHSAPILDDMAAVLRGVDRDEISGRRQQDHEYVLEDTTS